MNTPFGRPPVQANKVSPIKRYVPIEKVQPLQSEQNVPNGVISMNPEHDEHIGKFSEPPSII